MRSSHCIPCDHFQRKILALIKLCVVTGNQFQKIVLPKHTLKDQVEFTNPSQKQSYSSVVNQVLVKLSNLTDLKLGSGFQIPVQKSHPHRSTPIYQTTTPTHNYFNELLVFNFVSSLDAHNFKHSTVKIIRLTRQPCDAWCGLGSKLLQQSSNVLLYLKRVRQLAFNLAAAKELILFRDKLEHAQAFLFLNTEITAIHD